ncbi:acetyltransferase (GNAT) family protein [Georgenia soli]|uniref:Acetyltransferase (GNAT) family protein n=1 Tax=Georgenia soli TaxID=638953 RepID=A0A2A9ELV9_9MICO|nr:GNAT family N-acetyltransferase [Georgenia soli]PFG39898.1 acetyltransferase (GNAT) family protein [Georgenia soli]
MELTDQGITVERVSEQDWRTLRDVRLRALAEAPQAFGSTLERELAFDESTWRERAAAGRTFLALRAGQVVGLAGYYVEPGHEDERQLVSMWVDPYARGSGAAALLVSAVREAAAAEGARTLTLFVADGNDRARHLYERLGFRSTGERQALPSDPLRGEERFALSLR